MKNIFKVLTVLFLVLAAPALAQTNLTFMPMGLNTNTLGNERPTDGSGKWIAHGYYAPFSKTITEICIITKSKANTLGPTDGEIHLYSTDANGQPNVSLASGSFDPNTNGFHCVTSLSQATASGTQYWVVSKNLNGVPGTNYFYVFNAPTALVASPLGGLNISGTVDKLGMGVRQTANGGSDGWNAGGTTAAGTYRIKFSDNSYFGQLVTNTEPPSGPIAVADRIYGTNEVGNFFTTHANVSPRIRCVAMLGAVVAGSPTGSIRYGLYEGTTFVAYTVPHSQPLTSGGNAWIPGCFSTVQALSPSTNYRLVMAETTQSDTSADSYGPYRIDWDTDTDSLPLKPYNGTIAKTVCSGSCSGGTWTNTAGSFYQMMMAPDIGDEFVATGGGGGGILRSENNGGMQ